MLTSRILAACLLVSLCALASCSDDEGVVGIDAQPVDDSKRDVFRVLVVDANNIVIGKVAGCITR